MHATRWGSEATFFLPSFIMEQVVCFVVICLFFHQRWQRGLNGLCKWWEAEHPICYHGLWLKQCVPVATILSVGFLIPGLWKVWWCGLYTEVQAKIPWVLNFLIMAEIAACESVLWIIFRDLFWMASLEPAFFFLLKLFSKNLIFNIKSLSH